MKFTKMLLLLVAMTVGLNSYADSPKDLSTDLDKISQATQMIQNKQYNEAKKSLESVSSKDLEFVKNMHLGDIAYLEGQNKEAVAYYKIAQMNSKDQIMSEFMQKKIDYVITTKGA